MTTEKDDLSEVSVCGPVIISNAAEEVRSFVNDAFDLLEPIKDLYYLLDDEMDRLEEIDDSADQALIYEIRIARTAMGLIAEKAKKLSRRAIYSKRNLDHKWQDIEQESMHREPPQ